MFGERIMVLRKQGNYVFELPKQETKKVPPPQKSDIPNCPTRLSVSRVKLFDKCPLAYKLSYIEGLGMLDDAERLVAGKEIHDMFYYASLNANPEIIRSFEGYAKYADDCENFLEFSRSRMHDTGSSIPLYAEKEIYDKDDDVLLYVDRIDREGKKDLSILDYKTGKSHPMKFHHFQLALYVYYVEKHLGLKVTKWGVFYSAHNKIIYQKVDRNKVNMIPIILKHIKDKMIRDIEGDDFKARPSVMCNFCSFMQYGLCKPDAAEMKKNKAFDLTGVFCNDWGKLKIKKGSRYSSGKQKD